jgi:hypothetical protein
MLSRIFICLAVFTVSAFLIPGAADATQPGRLRPCGYPFGVGAGTRGHPCFEADKQPKGANTFKQMYRPPPK